MDLWDLYREITVVGFLFQLLLDLQELVLHGVVLQVVEDTLKVELQTAPDRIEVLPFGDCEAEILLHLEEWGK